VTNEAQAIAVLELEIDAVERTHDNGAVVGRQATAQGLEESQLDGLGRRIDDWKINDNPSKEYVSHEMSRALTSKG
jgi:hypothetical protein